MKKIIKISKNHKDMRNLFLVSRASLFLLLLHFMFSERRFFPRNLITFKMIIDPDRHQYNFWSE